MRSFRFTSTGTSGDNSDQQQQISCDLKMIPAGSTPVGTASPDCPWGETDCRTPHHADYKNGHNGPYIDYNKLFHAQMPDCDCYTPDQCEAHRSGFSARAFCAIDKSDALRNQQAGYEDQSQPCDDGLNMCYVLNTFDDEIESDDQIMRGVCENCRNLTTAQDCQERDKN